MVDLLHLTRRCMVASGGNPGVGALLGPNNEMLIFDKRML